MSEKNTNTKTGDRPDSEPHAVQVRTKQMFDLDLAEGYVNLETLLNSITLKPGYTAEEYLARSREMIQVVMDDRGRPMPDTLAITDFILMDSSETSYVGALGFVLISYDPVRIPLLLNEQKKNYKGPFAFWKVVSTTVLNYVIKNSPFDNEKRAIIIRDWALEEERFTREKSSKNKNKIIPFSAFLAKPNPLLIDLLKEKLSGATGDKFITMFSALIRAGYIPKHNIRSMSSFYVSCINEFGELCGKTKFNDDLKMLINNEGIRPPEENEWRTLIMEFDKPIQNQIS